MGGPGGADFPARFPDRPLQDERSGVSWWIDLEAVPGIGTGNYRGYIRALEARRAAFKELGATATDHGQPVGGSGRALRMGGVAAL